MKARNDTSIDIKANWREQNLSIYSESNCFGALV